MNGITLDGFIYEADNGERTLYSWEHFRNQTLQTVFTYLQDEVFA